MPRTLNRRAIFPLVFTLSIALLVIVFFFSLSSGRYPVSSETFLNIVSSKYFGAEATYTSAELNLFSSIRLPRLIAAAIIGAGLSLAGATFQGIFRNPLVSPYQLGVSQGASVGAASAILLGLGAVWTQSLALAGGLLAVGAATLIPRILKNRTTLMLVLSGVIVGGFATAAVSALKFIADPETQLATIEFWIMGSLSNARQASVTQLAILAVPCMIGLLLMRWKINVLSLGDADAQSLGTNVVLTRGLAILLATLLTASCVCLAGAISWVGLVIPHMCRLMVGSNHLKLMPLTITFGAAFMMFVDTLARSLTEAEIPLSVLTGFIGAPLFLILLVIGRVRIK